LGYAPKYSTTAALRNFMLAENSKARDQSVTSHEFDDFGMDKNYIAAYGRTLFNFLHQHYWRVEHRGLEYVPREGRAILVGVHRGFMPWDAVMALHTIVNEVKRYPRFLIHPGLIKFPFLFNFHTKLGGIIACQENADYVLDRDELLTIYPEGIRGAFSLFRQPYRLKKFRDDYVKIALRHRAPIVPFVTVGSAEIFPILKRIDWGWWKRWTEWPFFPLTPTWPLLPVPLPSKLHMKFLPAKLIAFVIVAAILFGCSGKIPNPEDVVEGAPSPDFSLTALDGATFRNSSLKGNVVVLNFWATWCVPCQSEMPVLKE